MSQNGENTFWGQLVYNFCILLKTYSSKKSNSNLHPVSVGVAMLLVDKGMNWTCWITVIMPLTWHCLNVCAYEWQEQLPGGIRSVRLGDIKNQFKIQHSPLSWWHDPMWQINYFRLHSPNQPTTVRRRSGWRQKRAPNVPIWQICRSKFESEWNVEHEPSSQLGNSRLNEDYKSVLDLNCNVEIGQDITFFAGHFQNLNIHVWQGSTSCSTLPSRVHVGWENME